jgi:membrane protein DedA with SNARE-associated domain
MDTSFLDRAFEVLLYTPSAVPYIAAFSILLLCGLGLPIPEDITLFLMGFLSFNGIADFKISVVVCLLGVLIGDSIIYWLGRRYGLHLTRHRLLSRALTPERMEKTKELFHRWGNKVIITARFMPGFRAPTYFSAGALHLPFRVFIFYDSIASFLSVPLLIGVTYHFGDQINWAIRAAKEVQFGIAGTILAIILIFVAKHYFFKARRRKALKADN